MLLDLIARIDRRTLIWGGFTSQTYPTSVGRLHVIEGCGSGDLPPLLIFHGVNSRATNYRLVLPQLLKRFRRIIVPDLPGHGLSDQPNVLNPDVINAGVSELLDQVLTEPAIVFGNSLGGVSAIRFALARPETTLGLFLSSPGGAYQSAADLKRFLSRFQFNDKADALAFVDLLHLHPPWYRRLIAGSVHQLFTRPMMRDFFAKLTPADLLTPEELAELQMPTLLCWGRGDRLMPLDHFHFYKSYLPAHALIEDPVEFGHSPYQDRPGMLARRIISFGESL